MSSHFESVGEVTASAVELFDYLDDPRHLAAHMDRPSWMMAGGSMHLELDAAQARAPGARMRLAGGMLGMQLSLEEEVTERVAPMRKSWQTIGSPRLLIMSWYRMGFEVLPIAGGCRLRVFIDYELPERRPDRWLGRLFARRYARWCTERMAGDAVRHFSASGVDRHQAAPGRPG